MNRSSSSVTWSSPEYLYDTDDQYRMGDICWLKRKDECFEDATADLPEDCFNHPVVFLKADNSGAAASIFIVSYLSRDKEFTNLGIDNLI